MSGQVLDKLQKDVRVIKFQNMLNSGNFNVDTDSYIKELDSLHATRRVRNLSTKDVIHNAQKKIISATVQNQAYRSRCVEIKMTCFKAEQLIQSHYDALADYLKVSYKKALSIYRTNAERDSVVANVLSDANYRLQQIQLVQSLCDIIIDDIDKASWSIRALTDVLKIAATPETI